MRCHSMPCFHPMQAVECGVTKTGKRKLKFVGDVHSGRNVVDGLLIPCGQCAGCRLERSRQWAVRIMHEASFFEDNCFVTLTYNDAFLPSDNSLHVEDFQKFMKRLRRRYSDVRFFHCGEYGELNNRPHFHVALFNIDFQDKQLFTVRNGNPIYTSRSLEDLWPFGFSSIGSLTFESAAYIARYIMKKVIGKDAPLHYSDIDWSSGEIVGQRKPEYVTMSRRPGIGKAWFDKFGKQTYNWDYVVMNGRECRPPKYYDSQFELIDPDKLSAIKDSRRSKADVYASNNTPERLIVREKLQLRRLNFLPRKLDGDL